MYLSMIVSADFPLPPPVTLHSPHTCSSGVNSVSGPCSLRCGNVCVYQPEPMRWGGLSQNSKPWATTSTPGTNLLLFIQIMFQSRQRGRQTHKVQEKYLGSSLNKNCLIISGSLWEIPAAVLGHTQDDEEDGSAPSPASATGPPKPVQIRLPCPAPCCWFLEDVPDSVQKTSQVWD